MVHKEIHHVDMSQSEIKNNIPKQENSIDQHSQHMKPLVIYLNQPNDTWSNPKYHKSNPELTWHKGIICENQLCRVVAREF